MLATRYINQLPAAEIAMALNDALAKASCVVVTAPPGAGKSTLLPLTIWEQLSSDTEKIIVLEPRRIAARQVAMRMAEMIGEEAGQTIGYRVRHETCVSARTRIEVVTEGVLTRMLIDDPTLDGIGVVIFDEFHERSLHTDVSLALTRETQRQLRDDLRIVIMSATIDTTNLCSELHAPLIQSAGRIFPVEVRYYPDWSTTRDQSDIAPGIVRCIARALRADEGDILVFLPGQGEILQCKELLDNAFNRGDDSSVLVTMLYGQLSMEEQNRALRPDHDGRRKIVLATNIAETSLTIEGVRVVIDSGLYRTLVYDTKSGLSHLETSTISLDMANQRMGRAGRLTNGVCYRLWSPTSEHLMKSCRTPEIVDADLVPTLLDLVAWQGHARIDTIQQLPWLNQPETGKLHTAKQLLTDLGAIDEQDKLTDKGRRMSQLPCHPRIANMLLMARDEEEKAMACVVAAELEDGNIERLAADYRRLMHVSIRIQDVSPYLRGRLIALAYPERVRPEGQGWIAIAKMDTKTGKVFMSAPVNVDDIPELCYERRQLCWDSRQGGIVAQMERRIGSHVISARPLTDIRQEDVASTIAKAAIKEGLSMFDWSDAVKNLQQRIATVRSWHNELGIPDLSQENILRRAAEWLPFFIGNARTINELRKIDLCAVIWSMLDYEQQQAIDRIAPSHIIVPTGSRIRIEYRMGAELPILRVRLQECFGMTDTPRIDDGARQVLMELLSPGFKPVQLTQDLHSFWSTTYFEVRKELKRRYPKHHWPDNPLEANPVRGVRRPN